MAALLIASCSMFGPGPGLHPVDDPADRAWADDGDLAALDAAIAQSIRYYRRLPPDTTFTYGTWIYRPAEMIRSLAYFRELARDPATLPERLASDFLVFESVRRGGENLFTGYFEPLLEGVAQPEPGRETPLLMRPPDMVEIPLERFGGDLPPRRLVGRLEGDQVVPYHSRESIQADDVLDGQAEPLAYVDEVDLFFLQIQGSGIVRFPDGREIQVNYAATNGHPYRSIGAELVRREEMTREEVTMQSLRRYLRDDPERARELLFTNPSYIFFRVVEEGPLGNIEVPLTPGRSLALDSRLFPKGGLAYIDIETPVPDDPEATGRLRRFMLVQDTGGVIRGHGRGDVFFGHGDEAEWMAGHLKHPGRLFLLVARKEVLADLPPLEDEGGEPEPGVTPNTPAEIPAPANETDTPAVPETFQP